MPSCSMSPHWRIFVPWWSYSVTKLQQFATPPSPPPTRSAVASLKDQHGISIPQELPASVPAQLFRCTH